jgi:hypothetical protein
MMFHQLSIALGVISLIGFFASSGKKKRISAFLLGLSLLMGIISFTALSPYSPPFTEQSAGQQELVAPPSPTPTPEYTRYSARGGRELKLLSQELEIDPYSEEICLSVIKDTYGFYISQSVLINGKEFFGGESSRSSQCHPLDEFGGVEKKKVKVKVEVPLIMSPIKGGKEKGDLYQFVQEQGGEAFYPVIRPK